MNLTLVLRCLAIAALFGAMRFGVLQGSLAQTPESTPSGHHGGHGAASCGESSMGDHGMMADDQSGTGMDGTPMAGMMMDQPFDLMFIDMMIPHHEGAVVMAEIALERSTRPEIIALSEAIISSQSAEITQMNEWRDAWYPGAPEMPMDDLMDALVGMMESGGHDGHMGGMHGTPEAGMGAGAAAMHASMDMGSQMEVICDDGIDFDLAFIDAMIPHHEGAVLMAMIAQEKAEHEELQNLADGIIEAQEREITQMQEWRASWFPEATPAS